VAEPTEAQRKRSQARERRRGQEAPAEDPPGDGGAETGEQPLEAVKHAAKVAAAGAAVGAAAAAARALTSHSDGTEHESEPADQAEEAPAAEQGSQEAEPGPGRDEPAAEAEEAPVEEESPAAESGPSRDEPSMNARDRQEPVQGASPDEATETVQRARQQLSALLERPVESVSAFERTHEGWLVTLEVVEVSRIPESTDVLASYEVELDDDRNLRRYARVRRYIRSQADRGDQR
jgi:hypothetical protein